MPANEVAFGFRCTRRTSFLELTMTRLAEGLRADWSLALDGLVTMVRDEIERSRNLPVNMARSKRRQEIHVIVYCHASECESTQVQLISLLRGRGHAMYGIKNLTAEEFLLTIVQVIPVHHLTGSRRFGRCRRRTRGCKIIGVKAHVTRAR